MIDDLVAMLRARADASPDRRAMTFLLDGEDQQAHLSFGQLDRRARAIGARLRASGQRAVLLYPPGLDYVSAFFGCLYGGAVAVPAYPPEPARLARTVRRLDNIAGDAGASMVLTTAEVLRAAEPILQEAPALARMRWIATDGEHDRDADLWRPPALGREAVALLQYTSGSTGTPRGVVLSHHNLLENQRMLASALQTSPESVLVSWLPLYHDMGLLLGMVHALHAGCRAVLMAPSDFLHRPYRWLQAISRHRGSISPAPNFAFELCVRKVTADQRAQLDLSCWEWAVNGAEPVRVETLDRFVNAFGRCGFRRSSLKPGYGLAEASLVVSLTPSRPEPLVLSLDGAALERGRVVQGGGMSARSAVGCGCPVDQQVVIVDPDTGHPCPPDVIGEIWVAGPHVGRGYWQRPEDSQVVFEAHLATGQGPYLRTGDLGFVAEGELFIAGRRKDLIILQGINHYPQDLEATVESSHPAVRPGCAAAFAVPVDGSDQVVVVAEVDPGRADSGRVDGNGHLEPIVRTIRAALQREHQVPLHAVVLLAPRTIPKTTSGKIQRSATRTAFLGDTLGELARDVRVRNTDREEQMTQMTQITIDATDLWASAGDVRISRLTEYLRNLVAHVLGLAPDTLDLEASVAALGVSSLEAVELNVALEDHLGVEVPRTLFLVEASIPVLARIVASLPRRKARAGDQPGARAPRDQPLPLSSAQVPFWHWEQRHPGTPAWNGMAALRLRGPLDRPAAARAFAEVLRRHEALRACFVRDAAGGATQRFEELAAIPIPLTDSERLSRTGPLRRAGPSGRGGSGGGVQPGASAPGAPPPVPAGPRRPRPADDRTPPRDRRRLAADLLA